MKPTPEEIKVKKEDILLNIDTIKTEAVNRQYDNNLMIHQYFTINQISECCRKNSDHSIALKWEEVKKTMNSQFYNVDMMNDFVCHNNLRLHYWTPTLADDQRYHQYISLLKQLYKGSYGQTWSGYVRKVKDFFVVKTALNDEEFENMRREAFIGIQLNVMRKTVPNFVMTLGYFELPKPVEVIKNKITYGIIGWEDNTKIDYSPYIIQEIVDKSVSLKSINDDISIVKNIDDTFIIPKSIDEEIKFLWGNVIQTLCAIVSANRQMDFTHYDLHNENVLLRKGVKNSSIRYELAEGIEVFLPGDYVSIIIDYGISHLNVDGRKIGYPGFEEYFISDQYSSVVCDFYRLVMFSLKDIKKKYPRYVLSQGQKIYELFGDSKTNVGDAIEKEMKENIFFIPNDKTFDPVDFIFNLASVTQYQHLSVCLEKGKRLLNCENFKCDSLNDLRQEVLTEYDDILMSLMSGFTNVRDIKNKSFMDKQDDDLDKLIKSSVNFINDTQVDQDDIHIRLNLINVNISSLEVHQMIKEILGEDKKVLDYIDVIIARLLRVKKLLIEDLRLIS